MVVSPFLTHKIARDYADPSTLVIKSVNGVTVKNLLHFVQLLRDNQIPVREVAAVRLS